MTGRDFNSGTVPVSRLEEKRGWLGRARSERQPPAECRFCCDGDIPSGRRCPACKQVVR